MRSAALALCGLPLSVTAHAYVFPPKRSCVRPPLLEEWRCAEATFLVRCQLILFPLFFIF